MNTNPRYLYNEKGEKQDVLLSYEVYEKLLGKLEDLEDLFSLRQAREQNKHKPYYSIEEVMEEFGTSPKENI